MSPSSPDQWPGSVERFGDSWSGRLTGRPVRGLELQASRAHVHSPENRPGAGTDQEKWSVSGAVGGADRGPPGVRTGRVGPTPRRPTGSSCSPVILAEGAWTHRPSPSLLSVRANRAAGGGARVAVSGPSGRTRRTRSWESPAGRSTPPAGPPSCLDRSRVTVAPLVEVSYGRVAEVGGGLFDVVQTYGRDYFWSWTVGFSLEYGGGPHRMGRYGAALERCDAARTSRYVMTARRMWWTGVIVTMAALAACGDQGPDPVDPGAGAPEPPGPPDPPEPPEPPSPPTDGLGLSVTGGGHNVPERFTSDLWVHGELRLHRDLGRIRSGRAIREMRSRSGGWTPAARRAWSTRLILPVWAR